MESFFYPRVLRVETGYSPLKQIANAWWTDILDYDIYNTVPRWWRRLEEKIRLDVFLALKAREIADRYDVIWADSEKVGVLLTGIDKPLMVLAHHLASKNKKVILRLTGIVKNWAGIGYLSDADRDFILTYYKVPPHRLIRVIAPDLTRFSSVQVMGGDSFILSLGVSKRDYSTLIIALQGLPGYSTEIYAGSKFGDFYKGKIQDPIPPWVQFKNPVSSEEAVALYKRAGFVVLPLIDTTQFSAGMNVAMEASASGKAVIATSILGMSTYVLDDVTGILVPPYDTHALRTAIHKLWTQPELAHRMGLAGRQYIEKEFNPAVVNNNIRKFLMKVHVASQNQV